MGRQKGTVELALEQGQVDQVCTQMKEIMPEKVSGKSLAKECLSDFVWALKPLALASPSMPIHNDSLFATLRKTVGQSEPDGKVWLMVYDLKVLMQFARKTWRRARESFKKDESWPLWVRSEPHVLELFENQKPFAEDDIGKAWGIETASQMRQKIVRELQGKVVEILDEELAGQKRLGKDLKPKAECKKIAKTNTSEKEQKEKAKFLMKKHKRKGQNGQFMVCAIHDNATGRQVAQLSSNTQAECESIVNKLVSELNQGKKTLDDVKVDLNTYKGRATQGAPSAPSSADSRSAVLALLAWAVGGVPSLEQPLRSVMVALPSWQSVIAYFHEAEERGWKGQYTDANGKKKVAGGPGLKQTQLYTAEFGRAIAAWWRAHGPVSAGRERRRWCLVQSADLSADAIKERIAMYSRLKHFDFSEAMLVEALEDLRRSHGSQM
ncbi:unnamed protein product [Cladocopium goreaui]|uniref:Uncharacterized protein n=1 Tax=Cladocopium goreaui TaxID=2562237 RepID=A0A9P1CBK9_9DINO|nr:unnamed protein product [Cladocopium goreaui]